MQLEHINVTVTDIEEATRFLTLVYPDSKIRGEGPRQQGGSWRHVGNDNAYIALQQETEPQRSNRVAYTDLGINHLGFVVDDLAAVVERLTQAGYQSNEMGVEEAGRTSTYFYDHSGIEWEFVEYHSDDFEVKNNYGGK
jgi:catechol 2,3-dioxygenase-like lactoylglutathione lyase family enzyme